MAPMVHGLEAEYYGRVKFIYLDADDPRTTEFQRTLGFYYQPEFYVLDGNGNVLRKFVGYISEDDLRSSFDQYLK
ncbi:MAG: thioredoxin family protein [Chloroflexi bacterium]|nr:thioredoxin family protein [Chloroflexota bacterium]